MNNSHTSPPFFTQSQYRTFRALQRADRSLIDDTGDASFPRDQTFVEFEGSTITIPVTITDIEREENGTFIREVIRLDEILRLKAFMRLEVYPAYMNQQGTREFQFIIRDWELFEQSRVFNRIFKGSFDGRRKQANDPVTGELDIYRETVGITFSLSKTYVKFHDQDNRNLAPVENPNSPPRPRQPYLIINNMANEWNRNNSLVWQLRTGDTGKFHVDFYRLPFTGRPYDAELNRFDLVATTANSPRNPGGVAAEDDFLAVGFPNHDSPVNQRTPKPLVVAWKLGSNPAIGPNGQGVIHEVSPPQSFCVADQGPAQGQPEDSADFPARITYAASYNVFLNDVQIVSDQAGVAMARGVHQMPPRDVLVAFEKPFAGEIADEGHNNELEPGDGNPRRYIRIEFGSGTCTGMVEITEAEWQRGKQLALTAQNNSRGLTAFGANLETSRPIGLF